MGTIVAIGGGGIHKKTTLPIDKEIIRLSGKSRPRLLFIPTASGDADRYCSYVKNYFGNYLHCNVDFLRLIKQLPTQKEIKKKILSSDIIYVGGGNTLKMMRLWRKLGVDRMLKQAHKKGIVLCGLSAGSICWFDAGHSDSMSYYNPKKWKYIKVKGLGLVHGINCPHFDSATLGVKRKKHFEQMIRKSGGTGIAIDNDCAVIFQGKTSRVIAAKKSAGAYEVRRKRGKVEVTKIH